MKKTIIALTIGLAIGAPTGFALYPYFSDVPENEWYYESVYSLTEKGIVEGYDDDTFKPGNYVNRAELAVMLDRLLLHLENPDSNNTNEKEYDEIIIDEEAPEESDSFALGNEVDSDALSLEGNILSINVGYSGGCSDHEFSLYGSSTFLESDPVQSSARLIHNANDDMCEAYLSDNLEFDLTPLADAYMTAYQSSGGSIYLTIRISDETSESIVFDF